MTVAREVLFKIVKSNVSICVHPLCVLSHVGIHTGSSISVPLPKASDHVYSITAFVTVVTRVELLKKIVKSNVSVCVHPSAFSVTWVYMPEAVYVVPLPKGPAQVYISQFVTFVVRELYFC